MNGFFANIEGKLKLLAKINLACGFLLLVACIFLGVHEKALLAGLGVGAIWLLVAWFSSLTLYAFAEILESVKETNKTLKLGLAQDVRQEEKSMEEARMAAAKAEQERREAERARMDAKKASYDAYWRAHAVERKALEAKKADAERKLKEMGGLATEQRKALQDLIRAIDQELTRDREG